MYDKTKSHIVVEHYDDTIIWLLTLSSYSFVLKV